MRSSASDADVAQPHRYLRFLALVAVGGFLGTGARYLVGLALPHRPGQWSWSTFLVNVVGAFVLGALLELLLGQGPDSGPRRAVRLGAGTGFLGAFTTYSALATDTVLLLDRGALTLALLYAGGSVVLGLVAATAGMLVAARGHPDDHRDRPIDPDLPGSP